jgi:N-acetylglutamate synthase-like GNAT family acetyltransferase
MAVETEQFEIVEVVDPREGNVIAEQVASLVLANLSDIEVSRKTINEQLEQMQGFKSFAALSEEEQVLGTGAIYVVRGTSSTEVFSAIANLTVHAEYRRRGIGRCLVKRLEQESAELGCRETFLVPSPESMRFYESLGYTLDTGRIVAKSV